MAPTMNSGNDNLQPDVIRVLMVDDDENDFFLTSLMLSKVETRRYEFQWASNYQEGLKAMVEGNYDVCLLDYRLGPDSGLDLLKESFNRGCRRPVILMTGQGDNAVDKEAIQRGAMDYLLKGHTGTGALQRTIRHAMTHWRVLEKLKVSEAERIELAAKLRDAENRISELESDPPSSRVGKEAKIQALS
jgi:DNA-binding NtrC family response regulator